MKNVLIMGSRGFQKNYGGWETLVDNLIKNWKNPDFSFTVFEITNNKREDKRILRKGNIDCIQVYSPKLGQFTMVLFSIRVFFYSLKFVKRNKISNPIYLVLGYRIGPLFALFRKYLTKIKAKIIINPDGIEWSRAKYNFIAKAYLRISEFFMINSSDKIVCDSYRILSYIQSTYKKKSNAAIYISYGADFSFENDLTTSSNIMEHFGLLKNQYFLVVGRFIPENNLELILYEFMKSKTNKKLVIVTNFEKNKFYKHLIDKLSFELDKRIIMLGPIYDKHTLSVLRLYAYAYIHGHSAGGTNPSLLEAMSLTSINILYDVEFNREVGLNYVYYFNKSNPLNKVLDKVENLDKESVAKLSNQCITRIKNFYNWDKVVDYYDALFNSLVKE